MGQEDKDSLPCTKKARPDEEYEISAESMSYVIIPQESCKRIVTFLESIFIYKWWDRSGQIWLALIVGYWYVFDRSSNDCSVGTLDVPEEIKSSEGSYLKLNNIHLMQNQKTLSETMKEILNVSANNMDAYKTKAEQIEKAFGGYPKYGMDM